MSLDVRASAAGGALLLAWLPLNSCLALLCGAPDDAAHQRRVLRLYRSKDEAWADWRRITEPVLLPGESLESLLTAGARQATGAKLPGEG